MTGLAREPESMGEAVRVRGLTKNFGRFRALDGLDLTVRTGEVHGFLGPNGAGKTTTIRVLLGMLRPSAGSVSVLGKNPWTDATSVHRRLAHVPGDVALWPTLTGGEVIDLLGRLRGGADRRRQAELLERFELDPTRRCRTYSTGNRRKVALISALASDVELLILDEPTAGLDPLMELAFRDVMADERARGRTVLLSSHILSEVEALCERVTIVRAGRVIESGSLAELRGAHRTRITAELREPVGVLATAPGVHDLEIDGTRVTCAVDAEHLDDVLRRLATAGVRAMTSGPTSLEELFLAHYRTTTGAEPVPAAAQAGR
jgi:ABC-2 type transport system ATP-binding protein